MNCRYYRCRTCNFVVDVKKGVTDEEALGNTDCMVEVDANRESIEDFPVIWQCPMCSTPRDEFEEYMEAAIDMEMQHEGDLPQSTPTDGSTLRANIRKPDAESDRYEDYRP